VSSEASSLEYFFLVILILNYHQMITKSRTFMHEDQEAPTRFPEAAFRQEATNTAAYHL